MCYCCWCSNIVIVKDRNNKVVVHTINSFKQSKQREKNFTK